MPSRVPSSSSPSPRTCPCKFPNRIYSGDHQILLTCSYSTPCPDHLVVHSVDEVTGEPQGFTAPLNHFASVSLDPTIHDSDSLSC